MKKVALETGSSRGLGRAQAIRLAKLGYDVAVNFVQDSSAPKAQEVLDIMKKEYGADGIAIQADVADYAQCEKLVHAVIEKFGHIDVLVNNAGVNVDRLFVETPLDDIRREIDVDFLAHIYMNKLVVPYMQKQKSGCIVNISSICGWKPTPWQVVYCGVKAAVMGMTRAMAAELGADGIRVNGIAPGFHITDMTMHDPEEVREEQKQLTPLGRFGTPEDVADGLECIVNTEFMTGQIISPNGGLWMH